MIVYLHRLSGVLFYLIAGTFFLAYLFFYNGIGGMLGKWWLTVGDLPLAMVAMLYGGTSLYLSVKPRNSDSLTLKIAIFLPLGLLFAALLVMNFWPLVTS